MARKPKESKTEKEDRTLIEVQSHYKDWTDDLDIRMTRKNGWNDITDAYWGKLPDDWPYKSKVVDPRIRTSLIEKDARLINSKLRGRLVPREGSDVLSAKLNNAVLDYQWDIAQNGGSMEEKLLVASQDTRLYGSKFAFVTWLTLKDDDGNLLFDSNEMEILDIRDCGMDFAATHIKDARWFQHRKYWSLDELDNYNKTVNKEAKYTLVDELKRRVKDNSYNKSDKRDVEYTSRIKHLKGLEDRLGDDIAFPVVELVTEYRKNRWITFAPRYNLIVRDIKNPFDHGRIPIAQLRYYPIQDDAFGESEVEPVISLWRAIQAVLCGYLDEMNDKMQPPIKIVEGQARIETIAYGPGAQWLVNSQDAVQEVRTNGEAQRWFQSTYSSLVSAFNVAMGDLSQGTSAVDPFNSDKTATEIKQTVRQQQNRDQRNQNALAEFIKDVMQMWLSNNRQFLFSDPDKQEHVLRILGTDSFQYFKRMGLDEMELTDEASTMIADIIEQMEGNIDDSELESLIDAGKIPKYPVQENPDEKDPTKIILKPKMRMNKLEDSAELSIIPEDIQGSFDFVADVKSMAVNAGDELMNARMRAIQMITQNQVIPQFLQQEGYRANIKELLTTTFEDLGLRDADRFFEQIGDPNVPGTTQTNPGIPGSGQAMQDPGVPGVPQANTGTMPEIPGASQPQPIQQ